ncbi:hypothetical protein HAX54_040212 [Datura stramonium]|uniref:Uncharacterized protein n=1 Tax=Datura stramonium TaxID=4076 RepID=A0ABS8SJR1_DATST|nr:hypothetical protein [Datura stramonium]
MGACTSKPSNYPRDNITVAANGATLPVKSTPNNNDDDNSHHQREKDEKGRTRFLGTSMSWEELGRAFGYTCRAKFKKGEVKGQEVAVKVIPKSKMTCQ